jgi:hypothetical protein
MGASGAGTIEEATYHIQVTGDGARRDSVRPVGNETVLDAIATLPGKVIARLSKAKIRVLRGANILEVDWRKMVRYGDSSTNYLLFRGDRLVIELRGPGR